MIIEIEINGARVIVSGDNLSVSVTDATGKQISGFNPDRDYSERMPVAAVSKQVKARHRSPSLQTISDIFDVFGGNASVARILNVGASTASEMKRRESIPVEYWPALVDEAKRMGCDDVSLEAIALIAAEAGARRRAKLQENAA